MLSVPQNYTVAQLKQAIQQLGFKPPSNLKKAELQLYYEGALKMRQEGIPETVPKKSLQLSYTAVSPDSSMDYLSHLHTYGWAVTTVPNLDAVHIRTQLLQWLQRTCPDFNPEDMSTWTRRNIPYNIHGIFKQWVGHLEPIWQTREACVPIFEQIWGTSDLLTSFDGFCLLTPGNHHNYKQWMHCDQGRQVTHFACVQGLVNLYDNGPQDGGTLLMSGSHAQFEQYLQKHPVDGIKAFYAIDPEDTTLSQCRIIKPCLEPGEILLWDSRTFHCNLAPNNNNPRMCVYVSMMPKAYATAQELTKRRQLAQEGRMTGHWCYGPFFSVNSKQPNPMYTKDTPKPDLEIAEFTPERARLIS